MQTYILSRTVFQASCSIGQIIAFDRGACLHCIRSQ